MHINVEHLPYANHVLQTGSFLINTTNGTFKFIPLQTKIKFKIQKFNCVLPGRLITKPAQLNLSVCLITIVTLFCTTHSSYY